MDASLRPDATVYTTDDVISMAGTMADDTPNPSAKASAQDPLPVVLKAALAHVERADRADKSAQDHRTSAGLRFKELKDRVASGEAGKGISWAAYCAQHVPMLTQRTVERYIDIAEGRTNNELVNSPQPSGASTQEEEEAFREAHYKSAQKDAWRKRQEDTAAGRKSDPETAYHNWRWPGPDSPYARAAWNSQCDAYNKGRGKVWDGVKDAPYHFWRNARGFPDDAQSRAMWDRGDSNGNRDDGVGNNMADDKAKTSAKRDPEARRKQNAEAQARRRAKSSTIREANGGKASRPRMDRETSEQYSRLAMIAKVLNAGQLQIVCDWIDTEWPGTEEKAAAAKAERDKTSNGANNASVPGE